MFAVKFALPPLLAFLASTSAATFDKRGEQQVKLRVPGTVKTDPKYAGDCLGIWHDDGLKKDAVKIVKCDDAPRWTVPFEGAQLINVNEPSAANKALDVFSDQGSVFVIRSKTGKQWTIEEGKISFSENGGKKCITYKANNDAPVQARDCKKGSDDPAIPEKQVWELVKP